MPRVTVVTPNFNHARYLPRRLDSILAQTFRDFELIVLDDASTDDSRAVIQAYAARDPRIVTIFNSVNNGSPFRQWNLGLSHARGEYVWFAESDDYADPELLGTLVDRLDRHPNVGLAMCQSWIVDQDDNVLGNHLEELELTMKSPRWRGDYINAGRDECLNYLYWRNTIPNASAVVHRRSTLERAGGPPEDMLINGDWMTYVNVLDISDIAFISTPLNYFRQHQHTVRSRTSKVEIGFPELHRLRRILIKRYGLRTILPNYNECLPHFVGSWISEVRRPPHNKVPAGESLAILAWLARTDLRAFVIALRILGPEQAAKLVRRLGVLAIARRIKKALAMNHFV